MEMRCSRDALPLLLAVLGCAMIALTLADGRRGMAADIGPAPPAYLNLTEEADDSTGSYDWGEDEYGYVYTHPEDEFNDEYEADGQTDTDEGEYTYDDKSEHEYDFENECSTDDYKYTDNPTSDENEYVYNDDEYVANENSGHSYEEDGKPTDMDDEVYSEYDDEMDDEVDDEMDDEVDDEMDDDVDDQMDDEADDEMDDEVDDEMDDEVDETADEEDGYSYEYAYPEETGEQVESTQPDEYSYYNEFGHAGGGLDETASEADGSWTTDDVDAVQPDADNHVGQYDYWASESGEVSQQISEDESADYEYDDYEYEYYDYEYDDSLGCHMECYDEEPSAAVQKQGLELFAWGPAELLLATDREVLRSMERLCEEPSGVRRAALNEYIESLGMEAIDFATRFEDATGIEVLGLADDLPGCAALFGSFRLLERGELNVDEAVDLLRKSLAGLSRQWIEGVSEITASAFEDSSESRPRTASAKRPLFGTVISLAAQSLDDLGGAICSLSRRLDELKGKF